MPELDTQLDDADVMNDGSQGDQGTPDGSDEGDGDFLTVDERTKYKTREDALKGFREAGTRIAQLSGWEKEVAQKYNIRDPKQVATLLNELVELRKQNAARATASKGNPNGQDGKDSSQSDEQLTAEEKKARDWLKANGVKVGFVPKEEFETLKAELKALQDAGKQSTDAQFETLVESGRSSLTELMKAEKLPFDNPKFASKVENLVKSFIEEDEERIAAFYRGGAALAKVIKEGFADAMEALNLVRTQASTDYANKKNNVINRNSKPLPRQGVSNNAAGGKKDAKKPGGITPEVHDRAFALLQSKIHGGAE